MEVTKVERFILYSLGRWFEEANKKIHDAPLQVSISKSLFINLVHSASIAQKKDRALYKNLLSLEEKRLISYQNKELELTNKGKRFYERIRGSIQPYIFVNERLEAKKVTSYTIKVQTVFR